MSQVFKIKYQGILRRICVPLFKDDIEDLRYSELDRKVRDFFQIPSTSPLTFTYVDTENDVVTLADNRDLKDACLTQKLNPLKLDVKVVPSEVTDKVPTVPGVCESEFDVEGLLKGLFPQSTAREIERVLSRYPPYLFTTVPAHALPEALDTFLRTLMEYKETEPVHKVSASAPTHFPHGQCSARFYNMESLCQRGRHNKVEAISGRVVHSGIVCDECGVTPIEGPRYKSIKKFDYDLCSKCFDAIGNVADYQKMECSVRNSHFPRVSVKEGSTALCSQGLYRTPPPLNSLDAQFVMDITILDGTVVEAGMSFAKVWRLKNSGMVAWPPSTQLVHIGGDLLGSTGAVILQLPEGGLPCNSEVDVLVPLRAPESPGSYTGHWSLMEPCGQMFGHRVWVIVQVVPKRSPKVILEVQKSYIVEAPLEDALPSLNKSTTGTLEALSEFGPSTDVDLDPAKVDFIARSNTSLVDVMDSLNLADTEEQHCGLHASETASIKELVPDDKNMTTLEEFELVDPPHELAFEVSKLSDENTDLSGVDESEVSSGWDHMLKELEEMGFHDTHTNKVLLKKNDGSIKLAVKELVEMEKQMSGKIKAA